MSAPHPLLVRLVRELLAGTADENSIQAANEAPEELWQRYDLVRMVGNSSEAMLAELVNTTIGRQAMADALQPEVDE